jgi:hypothetical protein
MGDVGSPSKGEIVENLLVAPTDNITVSMIGSFIKPYYLISIVEIEIEGTPLLIEIIDTPGYRDNDEDPNNRYY